MTSSMHSVLLCESSPCKPSRLGFFTRKLSKKHLFDVQKPASEVDDVQKPASEVDDSLEGNEAAGIGAILRSKRIEEALSAANAARQQRMNTAPPTPTLRHKKSPIEKLEAKIMSKENRCMELRNMIDAKKQEVPERKSMAGRRTLSASPLALSQRSPAPPDVFSDADGDSLQDLQELEARLLRREEECNSLHHQAQVLMRVLPVRSMAGRHAASMSNLNRVPLKPILMKENSVRCFKSVSWGPIL